MIAKFSKILFFHTVGGVAVDSDVYQRQNSLFSVHEVVGRDTVNIDLLKQLRGLKHAINRNNNVDTAAAFTK